MAIFLDNYETLYDLLCASPEFNDITFVHAYDTKKITRPVKNPICSIGIKNTYTYSDAYAYQNVVLKIYIPLSYGGDTCHEYINSLGEYLLKNTKGIVSIASGDISYDPYSMSFTSELTVKINTRAQINNTETSPDEEPTAVEIDGTVFDAYYVTAYVKNSYHAVREIWNSNPVGFVPGEENIVIELKFLEKRVLDKLLNLKDFSLRFGNQLYTGCHFTDIEYDHAKNVVTKAQIYARKSWVVEG